MAPIGELERGANPGIGTVPDIRLTPDCGQTEVHHKMVRLAVVNGPKRAIKCSKSTASLEWAPIIGLSRMRTESAIYV
jgi:hypothetical protein